MGGENQTNYPMQRSNNLNNRLFFLRVSMGLKDVAYPFHDCEAGAGVSGGTKPEELEETSIQILKPNCSALRMY